MKKAGSFQWFLILGLLLSNCSKLTTTHITKEESFLKMFAGKCSMNSEIQFLPVQEGFSLREDIWLHTKNFSQDTIVFPPDSNIKILKFDSDKEGWTKIQNEMNYLASPEPYVLLEPTTGIFPGISSISFLPVLESNLPVELRILVTGNIYENGFPSDGCVSAYIDMIVRP